ncbi:MAG TPA: acetyl-CoA carboxylase, carboxyltransferase subunit beta [Candidatus Nitrosotenuis sp.]|jgi:acetyl-CoA carboxylase carboxyl transferase subunit beta|nr:acetyl-CoA carboxylase, carboxyltransferase subunit beta [Candidatus Nitrosotenuis sp.]
MAGLFDKLRAQKPRVQTQERSPERSSVPADLWVKCSGCGTAVYRKTFEEGLKVCQKCGFHHKLTARERLDLLADPDSFQEWDAGLRSTDPLGFGPEYLSKLEQDRSSTGLADAVLTGRATLSGLPLALGIMDFHFRGGSMGSVVGERITRLLERARQERLPAVVCTASGGARMQEGMLSLMQMARTSAAVNRLKQARLPYIVVMTDPTTAGVAASFAALGDVILAEPGAIVGFAGRRVIEKTIRQKLPPRFQTAEFNQEHGFIDRVVPRRELRATLAQLLSLLTVPLEAPRP